MTASTVTTLGAPAAKPSKAPAALVSAVFDFERETPGTLRFKERAEKGSEVIGTLYIKKAALNGKSPKSITVTVG